MRTKEDGFVLVQPEMERGRSPLVSISPFWARSLYLGFAITEQCVTGVAPSAWESFRGRVARLYEQDAPQEEILRHIGQYVWRWKRCWLSGAWDSRRASAIMR